MAIQLLLLAWRYRVPAAIVAIGLLTLVAAIDRGLLPEHPLGALLAGYLVYALGAGAATLALLLIVAPLLERTSRRDHSA